MLKKVVTYLLLISLLGFVSISSSAGFFKKKKTVKEQSVEQKIEKKKALLVQIYASWCPGCRNIQPTLDLLIKEDPEIELVKLDVSTASKAEASAKLARELKISEFYTAIKSKTATVAVFVPSTLEVVSLFQNSNDIDEYKAAIEKTKAKENEFAN